jgi:hypothetical protein
MATPRRGHRYQHHNPRLHYRTADHTPLTATRLPVGHSANRLTGPVAPADIGPQLKRCPLGRNAATAPALEESVKSALSPLVFGLLFACAKADVLVLDPIPRPATLADSVVVFLAEPAQSYVAIALLEVTDQSWGLSLESLARKMRTEAAKVGGHAVIIGRQSTESGTVIVPIGNMWYAGAMEEKKLVGKVIVFTAPTR